MTALQVGSALSNSVQVNRATTFVDQGIEFEVLVEVDPMDRSESTALQELQIRTPSGEWMPLKNLAPVNRYTGPSNIIRINQERMVELEAELGSLDLKTASGMAEEVLEGMHWPGGYRYELGGAAEEQRETFRYVMRAFLMAGTLSVRED